MITLLLLLIAFLLVCAFEWVPMEVAAVALVVALTLTGVLEPDAAISGFANQVVLAIAGLFVINAAIAKSGLIAWLGARLAGVAHRSPQVALALLLVTTSVASMFVSNVATVALLSPAAVVVCAQAGISASRFLMPLAFASLLGGTATLIGATGNLIVQGMAVDAGFRPFSFFEFAWVGLPILLVSLTYLVTVGWRTVPERRPVTADASRTLRDFLVEVSLPEDSDLAGKSLAEAALPRRFGLTLLAIRRHEDHIVAPGPSDTLEAGDRLVVEGSSDRIAAASASGAIATEHDVVVARADLENEAVNLYEVLVPPRSTLIGRSATELRIRQRWGITVLAVLRGAVPLRDRPERIEIRAGDELLLQGPAASLAELQREAGAILMSQVERTKLSFRRLAPPLAVLAGVVFLGATGWTSLAIAVLIGVTVLAVTGQLTVEEAVHAVDLKVVVVVACVLPLGAAFEASGALEPTSRMIGALDGVAGPWGVLAALFLVTSGLVQVVQKAAIALGVPLALAAAHGTASDPAPFLMAVAIAGSCAFLTPLAHPVNLMVHAPGQYRFSDYFRVGLPLHVLVTVVAVVLIPIVWPFG